MKYDRNARRNKYTTILSLIAIKERLQSLNNK